MYDALSYIVLKCRYLRSEVKGNWTQSSSLLV